MQVPARGGGGEARDGLGDLGGSRDGGGGIARAGDQGEHEDVGGDVDEGFSGQFQNRHGPIVGLGPDRPSAAVEEDRPHDEGAAPMSLLSIVVAVLGGLTAALAIYYAAKDLSADLVLLGAAALTAIGWIVLGITLGVRDATSAGPPPERVTLYGYVLTGLMLVVGGGWLGAFERTRWGSVVIAVTCAVTLVLLMRIHQIWPGGFA